MINIAIVGAGYWGKNLIRVFDSLPNCKVSAICDENQGRLDYYEDMGVHLVKSFDDLMCAGALYDAVAIATPSPTHAELACQAMEIGKHVFVEKPMATSFDAAKNMVVAAEVNKVKLMVGHLLLYHPAVRYILSADIGEPIYMYSRRVNLGIVRSEENAWWSLAPHDISVANALFGEPQSVICEGIAYTSRDIEDVVFGIVDYPEGKAHIHVSWMDPHKERTMTIVGTKKMIVFDDMHPTEKIRVYDKGVDIVEPTPSECYATLRFGDITIPKIVNEEPLRNECAHFIQCIEADIEPISSGRKALDTVWALERGYRV